MKDHRGLFLLLLSRGTGHAAGHVPGEQAALANSLRSCHCPSCLVCTGHTGF